MSVHTSTWLTIGPNRLFTSFCQWAPCSTRHFTTICPNNCPYWFFKLNVFARLEPKWFWPRHCHCGALISNPRPEDGGRAIIDDSPGHYIFNLFQMDPIICFSCFQIHTRWRPGSGEKRGSFRQLLKRMPGWVRLWGSTDKRVGEYDGSSKRATRRRGEELFVSPFYFRAFFDALTWQKKSQTVITVPGCVQKMFAEIRNRQNKSWHCVGALKGQTPCVPHEAGSLYPPRGFSQPTEPTIPSIKKYRYGLIFQWG